MIILNTVLIEEQQLSNDEVAEIIKLHEHRETLFARVKNLNPLKDMTRIRNLSKYLERIEFKMQEWWKFEINKDKHSWWFQIPHCQCSSVVNLSIHINNISGREFLPRQVSAECLIHG